MKSAREKNRDVHISGLKGFGTPSTKGKKQIIYERWIKMPPEILE